MRPLTPKLYVLAAIFLLASFAVIADDRTWLKEHYVMSVDLEILAEYTMIATVDEVEPRLSRCLYGDSQGRLLVMRFEVDTTTLEARTEFTSVATGESLVFDTPDGETITLELVGGSSFTYANEDSTTPEVRSQAAALMEDASASFKDTLENLAEIGSYHGEDMRNPGLTLAEVLYPEFSEAPARSSEVRTVHVLDFDPYTTAPTAFEQQFGAAYYQ